MSTTAVKFHNRRCLRDRSNTENGTDLRRISLDNAIYDLHQWCSRIRYNADDKNSKEVTLKRQSSQNLSKTSYYMEEIGIEFSCGLKHVPDGRMKNRWFGNLQKCVVICSSETKIADGSFAPKIKGEPIKKEKEATHLRMTLRTEGTPDIKT